MTTSDESNGGASGSGKADIASPRKYTDSMNQSGTVEGANWRRSQSIQNGTVIDGRVNRYLGL